MNKKFAKWLSWFLTFVVIMVNMPVMKPVLASDISNKVRVIIKNDTFTKENGANWDGVLVDTMVELSESSNANTVVGDAVRAAGYTITGVESNYITEIGGLEAYDGGSMSGWLGTLNDWFTITGFEEYSVANKTLQAGDEICMQYSCSWGSDIGSDWSGTSTLLKNISFSAGTLATAFDSNHTEYTLVIPDDAKEVMVVPTAENKNFQVRTYKNIYTPKEEGTEYKRSANIPVESGDKIIVGVGNQNWPSMNSAQTETVYTFNVKYASESVSKPVFEQLDFIASSVNGWTSGVTYQQDQLSYDLEIKKYSTSALTLQSTTKYDTEKYMAVAKYTDSLGDERCVPINSEKITTLSNMKFGVNKVEVVIYEKSDEGNSTTYIFNITRPYENTLKSFTVVPEGRNLLSTLYMNKPEGTIFQLDENGEISSTGISASCQNYKTFVLDGLKSFRIQLTGITDYVRIRISDDGVNYTEVTSGNTSPLYYFGNENEKKLYVQTISDSQYLENGFSDVETSGHEYTLTVVSVNDDAEDIGKIQTIFEETTEYLLKGNIPVVDSIGGDWRVTGLARAGQMSEEFRLGYFKNAYNYVKEIGSAKLHKAKASDNARMVLALSALGYDVTDVAGQNLLAPFSNLDYVKRQGINGLLWTLIALDSANYEIMEIAEEGTQTTRETLIQEILDRQLENGGFSLDDENSDADITAMVLQALAPYYLSDALKKEQKDSLISAVDRALVYLSEAQNGDGSYGSLGGDNSESTAQVVIALSSLGINPRTDARFVKNGTSVLSALLSYYHGNGRFIHYRNGEVNEMATEQAYLGLVSYYRLVNDENAIYRMSDVVIGENPVITDNSSNDNSDNNSKDNNNQLSGGQNNSNQDVNTDVSNNDKNTSQNSDKNHQTDNSLPKTGDSVNILPYALLWSSSIIFLCVTIRHRKRKISE